MTNAFDADLKRAFAAYEEPADQGFSVAVARRVAGRERSAQVLDAIHRGAMIVGVLAAAYFAFEIVAALGPGLLASFGLEIFHARGAFDQASFSLPIAPMLNVLGASMVQVTLALAAVAGGLVVVRTQQD